VVAAQEHHVGRVVYLQREEEEEAFDRERSSVDVIAKEQVFGGLG